MEEYVAPELEILELDEILTANNSRYDEDEMAGDWG